MAVGAALGWYLLCALLVFALNNPRATAWDAVRHPIAVLAHQHVPALQR